jgi:hypothetical protein
VRRARSVTSQLRRPWRASRRRHRRAGARPRRSPRPPRWRDRSCPTHSPRASWTAQRSQHPEGDARHRGRRGCLARPTRRSAGAATAVSGTSRALRGGPDRSALGRRRAARTSHLPERSRAPEGVEPAAYRVGERASVPVFALFSVLLRDDDSGSSRIGPAPDAIAPTAWARMCDTALNAASEGRRSAVETWLDHVSIPATSHGRGYLLRNPRRASMAPASPASAARSRNPRMASIARASPASAARSNQE